jgi:hypothetical protein
MNFFCGHSDGMVIVPFGKTDLGPVAKALVEKIASGTGRLYAPLEAIIQAYAEVQIKKIEARGQVEIEGVRKRAIERLAAEETKKQQNLEAIYGKTFELLEPGIEPETISRMDEDWIVFHSEKARLVSDEEMQTLWARVMAGEAKAPGSFSKRTLEFLSTMEKEDAHLFTSVCRFIVSDGWKSVPAIFFEESIPAIYTGSGIDYEACQHLSTIGLIEFSTPILKPIWRCYGAPEFQLSYFGEVRRFRVFEMNPREKKYCVDYGNVGLTKVGEQLARISGAEKGLFFFDFLESEWAKKGTLRVVA